MSHYLSPWVQFLKADFQISPAKFSLNCHLLGRLILMTLTGLLISFSWDRHHSPGDLPSLTHPITVTSGERGRSQGNITLPLFQLGNPSTEASLLTPTCSFALFLGCPGWGGTLSFFPAQRDPRAPCRKGYPETEDNFRILSGPFSPPQSCSARAALCEQWPSCATTPAVPAAKTPPECDSSPPLEDCHSGM